MNEVLAVSPCTVAAFYGQFIRMSQKEKIQTRQLTKYLHASTRLLSLVARGGTIRKRADMRIIGLPIMLSTQLLPHSILAVFVSSCLS